MDRAILLVGGAALILFSVVLLVNGALWERSPVIFVLVVIVVPVLAIAWFGIEERWRRRLPLLELSPRGIRVNAPGAPLRWIPAELIRDVRVLGGRWLVAWLVIEPTDAGELRATPSPLSRLWLLVANQNRVTIPASNVPYTPEQIADAIRRIVIRAESAESSEPSIRPNVP